MPAAAARVGGRPIRSRARGARAARAEVDAVSPRMMPRWPLDAYVKISRGRRELAAEAEALRAFGSNRAVRVIEIRSERNELVLERVAPGVPLAALATEDQAMGVVAELFKTGWP